MIRIIKNYIHLLNAVLASLYYRFPSSKLYTIGITGTDGKTTTAHLLYEILVKANTKVSMISTVYASIGGESYDTGFHVTTPNPWFLQKMMRKAVDGGDTHFILEVTSHGLDQNRVWGISFEYGVITNITHEHLDYHGTYEKYIGSKLKLIKHSKIAVVNKEDESFKYINKSIVQKLITYGLKKGDVTLRSLSFTPQIPGEYNKYNVLAAYAVSNSLGISDANAKKALSQFKGIEGRYEKIETNTGFDVIIDFAHTPFALKQILSSVKKNTNGKIIHVFGCAGLRDSKKRLLMGKISSDFADITVITEEDYRTEDFEKIANQIKSGMTKSQNAYVYKYRQDAINYATSIAKKGDLVILTGKGHEKSLCRGKSEHEWSEHKAVDKALKQLDQ